jgi:uncharacterized protein
MHIRELTREECDQVLARKHLAHLGCAHENQPYVVPVYLVHDQPKGCGASLYGFTTPGQKVDWMRENPLVCVEYSEVYAPDQWVSVVVFGRYQELPEPASEHETAPPHCPECRESGSEARISEDEHHRAWRILQSRAVYWEPGFTVAVGRPHYHAGQTIRPTFYRINVDRVTGHEAARDARDHASYAITHQPGRWGWLGRALTSAFRGKRKEASSTSP